LITEQSQLYYGEWINGWKTCKNSTYSTLSVLWKMSFVLPPLQKSPCIKKWEDDCGWWIRRDIEAALGLLKVLFHYFPQSTWIKPWKTSRLPLSGWESNPGPHGHEAVVHTTQPWSLELFHNLNLSVQLSVISGAQVRSQGNNTFL